MLEKSKEYSYYVLLIFLFAFPKAGFSMENIPIYFGFVILGIMSLLYILQFKFDKDVFCIFLIWYLFRTGIYFFEGESEFDTAFLANSTGYFLGILFMYMNKAYIQEYKEKAFKVLFYCGIFVVGFGIYQLIVGIDRSIVPGITYNYSQYMQGILYEDKHNSFLDTLKLPSTYQNGNMYGLFLLGYYPVFSYFTKNKNLILVLLGKSIILFSIFRTLSRAVIVAIIFYFIFTILISLIDILIDRSKLKDIFSLQKRITFLYMISIFILFLYSPSKDIIFSRIFGESKLIEATLGGRWTEASIAFTSFKEQLIGNLTYWNESFYLSTIHVLGVIIGTFFILVLLQLTIKLLGQIYIEYKKQTLLYYVGLSFLLLEFAAIAELGWGHFPIEMQFWFYISYILVYFPYKLRVKGGDSYD